MITTTTSNNILKAFFGQLQNVALASTCYIGLSATTPAIDGSNFTEPAAASGYSRTLLGIYSTSTSYVMDAPADGTISNGSNIIFFPEAIDGWESITHFGIFAAKTGGVPIFWGALTAPVSIPAGYIPIFRAGALSITLT